MADVIEKAHTRRSKPRLSSGEDAIQGRAIAPQFQQGKQLINQITSPSSALHGLHYSAAGTSVSWSSCQASFRSTCFVNAWAYQFPDTPGLKVTSVRSVVLRVRPGARLTSQLTSSIGLIAAAQPAQARDATTAQSKPAHSLAIARRFSLKAIYCRWFFRSSQSRCAATIGTSARECGIGNRMRQAFGLLSIADTGHAAVALAFALARATRPRLSSH